MPPAGTTGGDPEGDNGTAWMVKSAAEVLKLAVYVAGNAPGATTMVRACCVDPSDQFTKTYVVLLTT